MNNTPPLVFDSFTIKDVLRDAASMLSKISDSPDLDAELLLAFCLNKNRTYLHTWPEIKVNKEQYNQYHQLIIKRSADYPVAYLLGSQSFWTLELLVTPEVLIPRPETELLVETALEKIESIKKPKILDLGTGSGAIALAIASERPDANLFASDNSASALEVAKKNTEKYKLENQVTLINSQWFTEIKEKSFDLIVSNPPYISEDAPHLKETIRYEPITALVAKNNGMDDIKKIVSNSKNFLNQQGWLMIEHGYNQGKQTQSIFSELDYCNIDTLLDLNKNQRITFAQQCP